jgi:hypothetical protein
MGLQCLSVRYKSTAGCAKCTFVKLSLLSNIRTEYKEHSVPRDVRISFLNLNKAGRTVHVQNNKSMA